MHADIVQVLDEFDLLDILIVEKQGFKNFRGNEFWLDSMPGHCAGKIVKHCTDFDMLRRKVDGNTSEVMAKVEPFAGSRKGLVQNKPSQERREVAGLGNPQKRGRPDNTALRVPPSQKAFNPGDLVRGCIQLRLVDEEQLPFFQRDAQFALDLGLDIDLLFQFLGEKMKAVSSVFLRLVKGDIGIDHERVKCVAVFRKPRDAETCRRPDGRVFILDRDTEHIHKLRAQINQSFINLVDKQQEFVAPPSIGGPGVGLFQKLAQPAPDFSQENIAGRMSKCIVDTLELVQIEMHEREPVAVLATVDLADHVPLASGTIAQLRQIVLECQAGDLFDLRVQCLMHCADGLAQVSDLVATSGIGECQSLAARRNILSIVLDPNERGNDRPRMKNRQDQHEHQPAEDDGECPLQIADPL